MSFAQAPILPLIIGILNVTPDSFSDGGQYLKPDAAIEKAFCLVEEGADIIDIGAESTGKNSLPITLEEEWSRLEPVLKVIASKLTLSVDTYKAEIAARSLELGVKIINDVSAMRADSDMAKVISNGKSKVILMYSKETGQTPHVTETPNNERNIAYRNIISEVSEFLLERVKYALDSGIARENIILDPGLGLFLSKDPSYSWEVLSRIKEFLQLQLPLMVGASRKSFLKAPEETRASDRDPLSALIGVHLAQSGVDFIRTHNVKLTKDFLKTWNKINFN